MPREVSRAMSRVACLLLATWLPALAAAQESTSADVSPSGGSIWSRATLGGDWGGVRNRWAAMGLVVALDATYTFQGVARGGFNGSVFHRLSDEGDTGNTASGVLKLALDTGKAGMWEGGRFDLQMDARAGRSVLQRAGTASAVDVDALFPNVVDRFDREALAVTTFSFTQEVGAGVSLFGGLLNNAEGDANEIAGSSQTNAHFLNSGLLYSLVEDASVPNTSLGGGIGYEPNGRVSGSLSAFGTSESAGKDPFDRWQGTTLATEWTLAHSLAGHGGAQTFGVLYAIDARRTNIAADPRTVIDDLLRGQPVPATDTTTWALYYNAHQFVRGDAEGGWGPFLRLAVADGDPNPVRWDAAGGVGGTGLLPGRTRDRWGAGAFYLGMSSEDLVQRLGVDDELGGELFYNLAPTPWLHVTLDAQVIDSALKRADTACVLGVRTRIDF